MVDAKSKSFSSLNPYRLGNMFANSSKSSVPRQAFKRPLRSIRPPLLSLRIKFLFVISKKADLIVNENRSGSPPRDHHARDAARRNRVRIDLSPRNLRDRRPNPVPMRSDALERSASRLTHSRRRRDSF